MLISMTSHTNNCCTISWLSLFVLAYVVVLRARCLFHLSINSANQSNFYLQVLLYKGYMKVFFHTIINSHAGLKIPTAAWQ